MHTLRDFTEGRIGLLVEDTAEDRRVLNDLLENLYIDGFSWASDRSLLEISMDKLIQILTREGVCLASYYRDRTKIQSDMAKNYNCIPISELYSEDSGEIIEDLSISLKEY